MSFPKIYRDLRANEGAGPLLREDILPNNVVKSTAQSLTDSQKSQARKNIGAIDKAEDISMSTISNLIGSPVSVLKERLLAWLDTIPINRSLAAVAFSCDNNWIEKWNSGSTENLGEGTLWTAVTLTPVITTASGKYVQILASTYQGGFAALVTLANGGWLNVTPLALSKKIGAANGAYVSETWHEGSSWYRKWSDGWIEQGGFVAANMYSEATVTLFHPLTATNYTVLLGATGGSESTVRVQYDNKTSTSFRIYRHYTGDEGGNGYCYWMACGY